MFLHFQQDLVEIMKIFHYLEHVTGLEAGKQISYFYYPLEDLNEQPKIIGSFNGKEDFQII